MPDLHAILDARLWVARLGESDLCGWWATDSILGEDGAFVGPRVLPRTHATARARIAFAVARRACDERHPDPTAYHLFRLDPVTEDAVDGLMIDLLSDDEWWTPRTRALEALKGDVDPGTVLSEAGVVESPDVELVRRASLGPAGRSLPLEPATDIDETVRRLAAGFARSVLRSLAVPVTPRLTDE